MVPHDFILAQFTANGASKTIDSGVLDALAVTVENIGTGSLTGAAATSAAEKAADAVLSAMKLTARRTLPGGNSVKSIDDVRSEAFRLYSNHQGGYARALDGALIRLGRQNLDVGKSKFQLEADWSKTDQSGLDPAIDLSVAKVRIRRAERLNPNLRESVIMYSGQEVKTNPDDVEIEVPNLTAVLYYGGTLTEHDVTLKGNKHDYPFSFTQLTSAVQYGQESTSAPELFQLYDASRAYGRTVQPTSQISADGGFVVQIGELVRTK